MCNQNRHIEEEKMYPAVREKKNSIILVQVLKNMDFQWHIYELYKRLQKTH